MDYFKKAKRVVSEAREIASHVHGEYKQFQARDEPSSSPNGYPSTARDIHHYGQPSTPVQHQPHQRDAQNAFNMTSVAHALPPQQQHYRQPCHQPYLTPSKQSSYFRGSTSSPKSPTPSGASLTRLKGCPGESFVPVDFIQFYIFTPQFRSTAKSTDLPEHQFGICHTCYSTLIAPHPRIASVFQPLASTSTTPNGPQANPTSFSCDLALPAARMLLVTRCIPQQTAEPLLRFAAESTEWLSCGGQVITASVQYYSCRSIDDMGICKSCYEKYIRHTPFEHEFALTGPMPAGVSWICDLGDRGYIYKSTISELSESRPNFSRFADDANKRTRLPPCPGPNDTFPPPGNGGRVFTYEAVGGKSGVFCQGCYWDRILGTSMERHFNVFTELADEFRGQIGCDMTGIASKFAMEAAIKHNDDEVWRRCMEGRNRYPQCVGILGVDEEDLVGEDRDLNRWFHLREHPNIEICQWCYCTTVEVYGAAALFAPMARAMRPGVIRMCFLSVPENLDADKSDLANFENTLVWRGSILRTWLQDGYDKDGDFSAFGREAAKLAALPPPCSGGKRAHKPAAGRRWYGNHFLSAGDVHKTGIAVCEECFEYCIRGSPVEWFCGVDLTEKTYAKAPDGFCCNSCTPRQRRELRQACQRGVFNEFADYLAKRREVEARWNKVNDLCNEQADRQLMQKQQNDVANSIAALSHMQAMNATMNATMMRIGGSVAEAAAPDYGQRYGNSAVGYGFLTHNGAAAAQSDLNAAKLVRESRQISSWRPTGDTWQDTQYLLALSRVIQAEWEAIQ